MKIYHRYTGNVILEIENIKTDLRGVDLRFANLRGANLRGADLRDTDLRGADLRGADLRGVDLRGTDLQDADLRFADSIHSSFIGFLLNLIAHKRKHGGDVTLNFGKQSRMYDHLVRIGVIDYYTDLKVKNIFKRRII